MVVVSCPAGRNGPVLQPSSMLAAMDRGPVVDDLGALADDDEAAKGRLLALAEEPAGAAVVLSLLHQHIPAKSRKAPARAVEARCRERLGLPSKLALKRDTDLNELADELLEKKDVTAAEAVRRYVVLLNPDEPACVLNLVSLIEYEHEDHEQALVLLWPAVERFPNDADLNHFLGLVLALRFGRFAEALPFLRRAADLNPVEAGYRSNVAWASGAVGDDDALYEHALRALAMAGDRATEDDAWPRAEATLCLYLLGPAQERAQRFTELIANLQRGDQVQDWTFAPHVERAKRAKHPDADRLELLVSVICSEAKPKALDAWPAARDALAAAKRQPRQRTKVREADDPYYVELTSPPPGHTVPLLLHRFGLWLKEYEDGALGAFDELKAVAITGWETAGQAERLVREAFAFLKLCDGSQLVLVNRGAGEPQAVGLLDSEGECRTVAGSLEELFALWSKAETGIADLDDHENDDVDDARPALGQWLARNDIKPPSASAFDFAAWAGVPHAAERAEAAADVDLTATKGARYFERRQGKTVANWQIEQSGVRYSVAWSQNDGQSVGQSMTRDDEADATRMVASKIREKLREGFVEIFPAHAQVAKATPAAELRPVLQPYAEHAAKFDWQVRQLPGLTRSHQVFGGLGFAEFLLIASTETTGLWFAVKEGTYEEQHARSFLAFLEAHQAQVFAVSVAWKVKLPEPIGAFSHALVLGPEVAQVHQEGLSPRQLFQAFPIHDSEFRGDENISQAEARTKGRGCIPCSKWDRPAHPVLDLRVQSATAKKQAKLLIYDPKSKALQQSVTQLGSLPKGSFLEVKNYRGTVARVVSGEQLALQLGDAAAEELAAPHVVEKLNAFIRE